MKIDDLITKSDDELKDLINEIEEEIFNMRFQKVVSSVPNPKKHYFLRKDIARIKTILNKRESEKIKL
jgi:large subunit ribosomal protein L29